MSVAPRVVVVVGAGNAALCAALSARERGAEVSVLECAPRAERGGNTAFTAGTMRVVLRDGSDLGSVVDGPSAQAVELLERRPYRPGSSSTTSPGPAATAATRS